MTAPATQPTWATNANYVAGDAVGTPTKTAPSYETADGFRVGNASPPAAQPLNFVLNLLCQWVSFFASGEALEVTTPAIATSQNNYTFTGWSTALIVRLNITANVAFTGFDASATRSPKVLLNPTAFTATLSHEVTSTAANRNFNSTGADYAVGPNQAVLAVYDHTTQRWRHFPIGAVGGGGSVTEANVRAALAGALGIVNINGQPLEGVASIKAQTDIQLYRGTEKRFNSNGADTEIHAGAGGQIVLYDAGGTARLAINASGAVSLLNNELAAMGPGSTSTSGARLVDIPPLSTSTPANIGTTAAIGGSSAISRDDHVHALPESTFRAVANECTAACSFNGQGVNVGFISTNSGGSVTGAIRLAAGDIIKSRGAPATGLASTDLNLMTLDGSNSLELGANNIPVADLNSQTLTRMRVNGVNVVSCTSVLTTVATPLKITGAALTMPSIAAGSVPTPATGDRVLFFDSSNSGKFTVKDDTGATTVIGTQT